MKTNICILSHKSNISKSKQKFVPTLCPSMFYFKFVIKEGIRRSFYHLDRKDSSLNLTKRYCGSVIPPIIPSFSNTLYLKFKSDSSRYGGGFNIEWDGTATGRKTRKYFQYLPSFFTQYSDFY